MTTPELNESWRKTTALLRDARSQLSEAVEGIFGDEIAKFEDYLGHNELELALDSLEAAIFKSPYETLRVLELLTSAAESMGLENHATRFQGEIERMRREVAERWLKGDS